MASATLSFSPTRTPTRVRTRAPVLNPRFSLYFLHQSHPFPPFPLTTTKKTKTKTKTKTSSISFAYVSAPASDPSVSDPEPRIDSSGTLTEKDRAPKPNPISWGLLWTLLSRHKLRLAISAFALVGCTTCTLSMPIFSGRFFEVLIGARPEPLWRLLSKVGVLYALEPILTVIFVINLNTIWEKVMSTLRAHIFRRVLIQKVEFFDRYKVGELTGLLTSDLGSLKDVVSENISRDRGFRALSEASNSTPCTSHWDNMHTIYVVPSTCTYFGPSDAYCVCFSCCVQEINCARF
ncbi:hypothetical protein CMV_010710 [Castanea mollissima]|uniref:ABC transmembrane type-1 domain-containing protein n=1 Tax=Castanea mollissima TaxID=60419 RepID=A0A8J4R6J4_9ROSI|nr:hypothetical protein CMV_010710 [Castanea mollissima]